MGYALIKKLYEYKGIQFIFTIHNIFLTKINSGY